MMQVINLIFVLMLCASLTYTPHVHLLVSNISIYFAAKSVCTFKHLFHSSHSYLFLSFFFRRVFVSVCTVLRHPPYSNIQITLQIQSLMCTTPSLYLSSPVSKSSHSFTNLVSHIS